MSIASLGRLAWVPVLAVAAATAAWAGPKKTEPRKAISFINDVVPVLTRSGCNSGACHGAASGKGGFKLSLRGFAPEIDYAAIARLGRGRRINTAFPAQSLVLRKPLMEIPHRGGKAIQQGTPEYAILSNWLTQGAPPPDTRDPHVTGLRVSPPLHEEARRENGSSNSCPRRNRPACDWR